ncbi:MAG: type II toxin-antitoxin system VapC family toxin [Gemmatimonadales bacterium]
MVIDTSAVMAFLLNEPEAERVQTALSVERRRVMSAVNFLETQFICTGGRFGPDTAVGFERLIRATQLVILPFDEPQARIAGQAFQRYGKGQKHPAQLNLGDCAAYALAMALKEPLLFVGNDFSQTDVERC